MGYPTEDGSEHERLRVYPRAGTYTTHKEVFSLEKVTYVHLFMCLKSGCEGGFWGVLFGFFWCFCEKKLGVFFFYMDFCICVWYIFSICYR